MFNPYQIKTEFTVWEAAAAIIGIKRTHSDDFSEILPVAIELIRAIERKELKACPLVPAHQYVIITTSNGMQSNVDGLYFASIQRSDLLAWCDSRQIAPPLLFTDQGQPEREQGNDSAPIPPNFQTTLQEAGKHNADLQHAERNRLYREVITIARQQWSDGDKRQHSEMASYFLAMPKYAKLSRNRLLGELKQLATKMEKPYLIRGAKKSP